jgi:hypothetical protein
MRWRVSADGTDEFLNLVGAAEEEENQFRRRSDEHERQSVIPDQESRKSFIATTGQAF